MPHRGEGLPFNACLHFLKDFTPLLKSCLLHSCGSRIFQLFQGMRGVHVVYNTRSAAFRPRKRPYSKQYCISLVLGALLFFGRDLSIADYESFYKQSMYPLHPSVEKTADPTLSTLQTIILNSQDGSFLRVASRVFNSKFLSFIFVCIWNFTILLNVQYYMVTERIR